MENYIGGSTRRTARARAYFNDPRVSTLVRIRSCASGQARGEVRAFQSLPLSRSHGVDLNPGLKNQHVLYGNAHLDSSRRVVWLHLLQRARSYLARGPARTGGPPGARTMGFRSFTSVNSLDVDKWAVNDMSRREVQEAIMGQMVSAGFTPHRQKANNHHRMGICSCLSAGHGDHCRREGPRRARVSN